MVRGVPMIPRNNPDNILVQYTSKYWDEMGQNLKKYVKNAKKCPKWDLNFSHLKLFYGQIMHFYEDRNLFFIVRAIENLKIKKKISKFFSDF